MNYLVRVDYWYTQALQNSPNGGLARPDRAGNADIKYCIIVGWQLHQPLTLHHCRHQRRNIVNFFEVKKSAVTNQFSLHKCLIIADWLGDDDQLSLQLIVRREPGWNGQILTGLRERGNQGKPKLIESWVQIFADFVIRDRKRTVCFSLGARQVGRARHAVGGHSPRHREFRLRRLAIVAIGFASTKGEVYLAKKSS